MNSKIRLVRELLDNIKEILRHDSWGDLPMVTMITRRPLYDT